MDNKKSQIEFKLYCLIKQNNMSDSEEYEYNENDLKNQMKAVEKEEEIQVKEESNDEKKVKKERKKLTKKDKEDYEPEEDFDEDDYEELTKKKKKKKKGKKLGVQQFFEEAADEDEDGDYENGQFGEVDKKELEKIEREAIERKDAKKKINLAEKLEEKYKNVGEDDGVVMDEVEEYDEEEALYNRQPRVTNPKLWLVKCKMGKEKQNVQTLMNKYFYNEKQYNLKIFSVFSINALKGYFYIEAFREANVREAIAGISTIRQDSIKIVPFEEMTQVLSFDKLKKEEIKKKGQKKEKEDVVKVMYLKGERIKIIKGDLKGITATVINHEEGKIKLKTDVNGLEELEVPDHYISRSFEIGDNVVVELDMKNKGRSGRIVKIENEVATVYDETMMSNFRVNVEDIILSNKIDKKAVINSSFNYYDLVEIIGTKTCCLVLDILSHNLKVMDLKSNISSVATSQVKKINTL